MPGYAGKPLAQKLNFRADMIVAAVAAPSDYVELLGPLPEGLQLRHARKVSGEPERAVHLFVTERSVLEDSLSRLRKTLDSSGFVWVSWPKKASKVPREVTEDVIRDVALPLGFVDVKVCAVSEIWSST